MWGYSIEFWNSIIVWGTAIAAVTGAISVTSAFVAGIVGYRVSDIVQKTTSAQIAEANARAEAARQASAEANARAAEATLALERYKAPRSIDRAGLELIMSKLSAFAGQKYQVTTFWDLKEPMGFSNELHAALQRAGWNFVPHGEGGSFLLGGLSGVQVWVHPDAQAQTRKAADALVAALTQLEFAPQLKQRNRSRG
jgi:hypothetical protein